MILGFAPPTVTELFEFKPIFKLGGLEITFPVLLMLGVTILMMWFFISAFQRAQLVPEGSQNVAELAVDVIREQIVLPTLGPEGVGWLPFLTILFWWVFILNILEVVPPVLFPVTSKMGYPFMLAIIAWAIFNYLGIREQGFVGYFKNMMFPPGVPWWVYILLAPIELLSTVVVRPITLAIRLFANMVAGHMILAVLFAGSLVFWHSGIGKITFLLPFSLGAVLTLFEVFIALMQAFIITILTAVYIAGALHPEH